MTTQTVHELSFYGPLQKEKFEDTNGVIRSSKSNAMTNKKMAKNYL